LKIFIDIGHPAHVHYFRNFIKIMEQNGHEFCITARDKEVAHSLLSHYKIAYFNRGKRYSGFFMKFINIFIADFIILKYAFRFKPDIFLSFVSPYAAHVSKILRKPHIVFDDTEHAKLGHMLYIPFSDVILTPSCYYKQLGKKQIWFSGYMELCYLYPNYITNLKSGYEILHLNSDVKYVILRFVSWGANHDLGQKGISEKNKIKIVEKLKEKFRVFISSESKLPSILAEYQLNIHPANFHSVLKDAYLYIGEGSTTASECSVLGVPNIYINSLSVGYCTEQNEKYNLCFHLKTDDNLFEIMDHILSENKLQAIWQTRRLKMLSEKIDVTSFMVWFIENYPKSAEIMKNDQNFQKRFIH